MRSIKFRAWDTHEEVMNRVDYIDFANGIVGLSNENVRDYEQPVHRVKFMQSTNLLDKNGVEIYEGDIVKWGHLNQWSREQPHRIAEVKFDPDIQFHSQVGVFNFGSFAYRDTTETDLEVIGNIYENKELLKEQNK